MINVSELTKIFDTKKIIDNISCEIKNGSIFGLVGSNGSGKSTFLRILSGIFPASFGKVEIDGQSVFENIKIKQEIFFVPDNLCVPDSSTVSSLALFFSNVYRNWSNSLFDKYCDLLNINKKLKVSDESKENQKKIFLVLALSSQPKYLFLDETFDSLDPLNKKIFNSLLKENAVKNDMTTVLAINCLSDISAICDEIGIMHNGTLTKNNKFNKGKKDLYKFQVLHNNPNDFYNLTKSGLDIIKINNQNNFSTLLVRGNKDEIVSNLSTLKLVHFEEVPITVEEIFTEEMEAAGYDKEFFL